MPVAAVPGALDELLPEFEPEPEPELEPDPVPESPPVPSEPPAPDKPGTVARLVGVGVADAPFFVDDEVLDGLGFPLFMSVPSARNDPSTVGLFVSEMSPSSPSTLLYVYETVPVPFASLGGE